MKKIHTLVFFAIIYMAKSTLSAQDLKAEDSIVVDVTIMEKHLQDTSFTVVELIDCKITIKKKVNSTSGAVQYYNLEKKTDEGVVMSIRIKPNGMVSSFTHTTYDSTDGSASYFKFKTGYFFNYLRGSKGLYFSKSHYGIKNASGSDAKTWPQKRKKVLPKIKHAHETIEEIFSLLDVVVCIPKPNISPPRTLGFLYVLYLLQYYHESNQKYEKNLYPLTPFDSPDTLQTHPCTRSRCFYICR